MALPPSSIGTRAPAVRLERVDERGWRAVVDGRPLPGTFASQGEAREASRAEVLRRDALALGLLRRVRSNLERKRR